MEVVPERTRRAWAELDVIRALAAVAVVAGHLRALVFESWSQVSHQPVTAVLYAATSLGHQAVMVFFVLSGYLVGGGTMASLREGRWSWRRYLSRRIARLWVVLIPALLLGWAWDHLGMSLFSHTGVYTEQSADPAIINFSIHDRSTLSAFAGNLFFLQTIRVTPFGSNGPLWSLANEWWYYLLFPLFVAPFFSRANTLWRIGSILLAGAIVRFVGAAMTTYFLIWLLGVVVAELPVPRINSVAARALAITGAGAAFALASFGDRLAGLDGIWADAVVALAFSVMLYLLRDRDRSPLSAGSAFWKAAAGFSYTLYLVHLPLLIFVHAALLQRGIVHWQPAFATISATLAMLMAVVGYAWLVSRVTEARTDRFRSRFVEPTIDAIARLVPSRPFEATAGE